MLDQATIDRVLAVIDARIQRTPWAADARLLRLVRAEIVKLADAQPIPPELCGISGCVLLPHDRFVAHSYANTERTAP